jgi:heat shock protein HslJ
MCPDVSVGRSGTSFEQTRETGMSRQCACLLRFEDVGLEMTSVFLPVSLTVAMMAYPAMSQTPGLAGTSWQLVKFQGSDDKTLTPDDRVKYTIEFVPDGSLIARIDCNRGRGTWKSSGSSQIEFGPLALTRAQCPPGSLHDQIVKQWGNVRSYVIKDGHLFLALMADGGIYEFEPSTKKKP